MSRSVFILLCFVIIITEFIVADPCYYYVNYQKIVESDETNADRSKFFKQNHLTEFNDTTSHEIFGPQRKLKNHETYSSFLLLLADERDNLLIRIYMFLITFYVSAANHFLRIRL